MISVVLQLGQQFSGINAVSPASPVNKNVVIFSNKIHFSSQRTLLDCVIHITLFLSMPVSLLNNTCTSFSN